MSFENGIRSLSAANKFQPNTDIPESSSTPLEQIIQQSLPAENNERPLNFTHTLHWVKDDCSSILEHNAQLRTNLRPLPTIETDCKNDLTNQRRLQSFLDKISKATEKDSFLPSPNVLRKTNNQISQWIAEGYISLEVLNETKKGFPWEQIASAPHPAIMEQLILLNKILENSSAIPAQEKEFLMKQALILSKQPSTPLTPPEVLQEGIENCFTELGKLIFAIDRTPTHLLQQIEVHKGLGLTDWLNANFLAKIHKIKEETQEQYQKHLSVPIQSPEVASKIFLIRQISDCLILQDGTINGGLIDLLIRSFLPDDKFPLNYNIEATTHLSLLKCNPQVRNAFGTIEVPTSPLTPIHTIIRSVVPHANYSMSKREATVAALAAFLSHHRQGTAGSCFATFLTINMLAARPLDCIKDFAAIIKDNALTRQVDGVRIQFPFVLNSISSSLITPVTLSSDGSIIVDGTKKGFIWDAPGIKAALTAMHVPDIKQALLIQLEKTTEKTFSIQDLLKGFAKNNETYQKGVLAFVSQESDPLLHAWEGTIAGMSETNQLGIVKSSIVTTTLLTLLEALGKVSPPFPKPFIELFYSYLNEELNKSLRIQYDHSIVGQGMAADQQSSTGAFVLYDRNNSLSIQSWNRIDTPKNYQQLILKHALAMAQKTAEDVSSKMSQWNTILHNKLNEYIPTDNFLNDSLKNINNKNFGNTSPLSMVNELKYTPWIYKSGNNPKNILKVYFESTTLPTTVKFSPLSAEHLLQKIIEIGKSSNHQSHNTTGCNPYLYTPVRTPGLHSFSLMLGHPSLTKAWETPNSRDWLRASVINPGQAIANTPISNEMKAKLLKFCLRHCIPAAYAQEFLNCYRTFPENLTIKEFRYQLKGALLQIHRNNRKSVVNYMLDIDGEIYNLLPYSNKRILENSAVHFADTNWYSGINDTHFCFVVNPGNGKMEIWKVADNGKNLRPASQIAWITEHEWEFYEPFFLDKAQPLS